mgnify:CR=1 FL=1
MRRRWRYRGDGDRYRAAGIADGLFVEVHGSLSNTTVIAEELHCEDEPSDGIVEREGTAGSVDLEANTFVLMREGTTQPVRWTETVRAMLAGGARVLIECGPGKVLTGLNRRIDKNKDIAMLAIEDSESLQQALAACRSQS